MSFLVKNISGKIQSMPKKLGSLSLDANNWQVNETDYVEDGVISMYRNHTDVFYIIPDQQTLGVPANLSTTTNADGSVSVNGLVNPQLNNITIHSFSQSLDRSPTVYDNASLGYTVNSVWQAKGQIYKPAAAPDNNFAPWTPVHQNVQGNFVDVVGQTNAIFAGGLVAMKGGYVGAAIDVLVNGVTTSTINIRADGELDVSALQLAMAAANAGTDVLITKLYDQSGNNNHAVKDANFPAPRIDFDPVIGRYVMQSWQSSSTTPAMLRLPHGLVAAGGGSLTSGFGVIGNNYTSFALTRPLLTAAGPVAFYSIGDFSATDANVGAWSAATTYTIDQYVSNGFKSRINGNLNNALPAAGADNASWYYSPSEFTSLQLDTIGNGAWQVWDSLRDSHQGTTVDPISSCGLSVMTSICSASTTTARMNEAVGSGTVTAAHAYQGGWIGAQRSGAGLNPGYILGIAFANTAITAAQEQTIRYNAYARFNIQPQALDQVFLLGDSRFNSSAPLINSRVTSIGSTLQKAIGNKANVYNLGTGSQTSALILSGEVPYATSRYKAGVQNIAYVLAGVNDFIVSGLTPAQSLAGIKAIIAGLKASGITVRLINELATTNTTGSANTNLPILRGLITAAGTSGMGCDKIIDLLQYSQLADPSNTTFYADGLHPTETFWEIVANIIAQDIQSSAKVLTN